MDTDKCLYLKRMSCVRHIHEKEACIPCMFHHMERVSNWKKIIIQILHYKLYIFFDYNSAEGILYSVSWFLFTKNLCFVQSGCLTTTPIYLFVLHSVQLSKNDKAITWKHDYEIFDSPYDQEIGTEKVINKVDSESDLENEDVVIKQCSDDIKGLPNIYDDLFIDIQSKIVNKNNAKNHERTEGITNDSNNHERTEGVTNNLNDNERSEGVTNIDVDDLTTIYNVNDNNPDNDSTSCNDDKFDMKVTKCNSFVSEVSDLPSDKLTSNQRCSIVSGHLLTESVPESEEIIEKESTIREIKRRSTTPVEPHHLRRLVVTVAPVFKPNDSDINDGPISQENEESSSTSEVVSDHASRISQNTADSLSNSGVSGLRGEMTHTHSNDSDLTIDTPRSLQVNGMSASFRQTGSLPSTDQSRIAHSLPDNGKYSQATSQKMELSEQSSTQIGTKELRPNGAHSDQSIPGSKNALGHIDGKSGKFTMAVNNNISDRSDSNTTTSQRVDDRHRQPQHDQISAVNGPQVSFEPVAKIIHKLSIGERVLPQVSMRYELLRLYTFHTYPKENKPYIIRLAQAGFYYANNGDEAVCYCCARRRSLWDETDNPWSVHQRLNPSCKFLLKNDEVNVKIFHGPQNGRVSLETSSTSSTVTSLTGSYSSFRNERASSGEVNRISQPSINGHTHGEMNTSNPHAFRNLPTSFGGFATGTPQTRQAQAEPSASEPETSTRRPTRESIGEKLNKQGKCKFPKYIEASQRLASFQECTDIAVPIESLVESGLFYTGYGDCCRCHVCGIGLRHWSVSDDPWVEHARWSRNCDYVKQERGQEFIDLVHMAVGYTRENDEDSSNVQNNNEQSSVPAESNNVIDSLMHGSPAQSLLEMGYSTTIIRQALRAVFNEEGRSGITAVSLTEKVLMLENQQKESENATRASASASTEETKSGSGGAKSASGDSTKSANGGAKCGNISRPIPSDSSIPDLVMLYPSMKI
ncbi:Baculoviral IAP [Mactra antiquata]